MSDESNAGDAGKQTAPRSTVTTADVADLVEGLPSYEKATFRVYGHKGGVRLALPLTQKIGRAYFYGQPVPSHASITSFTEEQRKEQRLGGITAEVDFSDHDGAVAALGLLAEAVRAAPVPVRAERKVRAKKEVAVDGDVSVDDQQESDVTASDQSV